MVDSEVTRYRRRRRVIGMEVGLLASSFCIAGCVHYQPKPLNPIRSQADFLSRTLNNPGLEAFAKVNGPPVAFWPPQKLSLADANVIAAYYNPDLAVARTQLDSARAAVITAGGRPNPELAGAAGYETVSGHPVAIHFELSLPIETAGKRHYRILAAQEQLGATGVELQEAEWKTYARARDALFEYAIALQSAKAYDAEATQRAAEVSLLQQRLAVGEIAMPLLNQTRIAASEAALAAAAAEGRKETDLADLASALGLPVGAIEKLTPDISAFTPPPNLESLPFFSVQQKGLLNRLDVRRAELEYAAAEAQLHLAIAQQYPDIRLNPTYDYQEGFHLFTFGPSFPIPVLNRNRGPIAEANADRAATQARFEATQRHAIGEMQHALAQYKVALIQYQQADQHWLALQRMQEQQTERAVQLGGEDQLGLTEARVATAVAQRADADALDKALLAYGVLEDSVQVPLGSVHILNADKSHLTTMKGKP